MNIKTMMVAVVAMSIMNVTQAGTGLVPQNWDKGPSGRWHVQWDDALAFARSDMRPLLVLNPGRGYRRLKNTSRDAWEQIEFRKFANDYLSLLCVNGYSRNPQQKKHNKRVAKALDLARSGPVAYLYEPDGGYLGEVNCARLSVTQLVEEVHAVLTRVPTKRLTEDGKMLFNEGYAALSAKIDALQASLPKVTKADFKVKLVGVAVVSEKDRWNQKADFVPPETAIEVPFGKTALFKVEYAFPTGYSARVWTRDIWLPGQKGSTWYFGSNPSRLYSGTGVTTGFLSLLDRGKACHLTSLGISTSTEPELDDETQSWTISTNTVNITFQGKSMLPEAIDGMPK